MVVIDATMLLLLLRPDAGVPLDPATGAPVTDFQERLSHWIERMEAAGTTIIIPAPALSEALVRAGKAAPRIIERIKEFAVFQIAPFDTLEAIEVAEMTRAAIDAGDKRGGVSASWAKIKYDRQIVAIARVAQATTIYSDDDEIRTFGERAGLAVVGLAALPLPPKPDQIDWHAEGITATGADVPMLAPPEDKDAEEKSC